MRKISIVGWIALQPNHVVYLTHSEPNILENDDFLLDGHTHDYLVLPNGFGLTMKSRVKQVMITIATRYVEKHKLKEKA